MRLAESEDNIVGSWRKKDPSYTVLEILENTTPVVFCKTKNVLTN